jgi:hypothetical protein
MYMRVQVEAAAAAAAACVSVGKLLSSSLWQTSKEVFRLGSCRVTQIILYFFEN